MDYTPTLKEMKEPFDKLSYSDKLNFWDKYFWDEKTGFFSFYSTYGFKDIDANGLTIETYVTIFPTNNEEINLYNRWLLNNCQKPDYYNFEKQKAEYFEIIKDNPQPKVYTEVVIAEIKEALQKEKSSNLLLPKGLNIGYLSVVRKDNTFLYMDSEKFSVAVLGIAKGICDAHYLGFLEKQLELIKQGKQVIPSDINQPAETKAKSSQKILYPNDLHYPDDLVIITKERFKAQVHNIPIDEIFINLNKLPDVLKLQLAKAQKENPETCKRMLVEIRLLAMQWYNLDHIEDSQCNMLLYKLKNELKWYIDETERVYNALPGVAKVQIDNGEPETNVSAKEKEKRNYIPLAFYYYYKQSVGEIEWFDTWTGGREKAYKKIVSENYDTPVKTAWKQFQRVYVKIEQEHSSNRYQLCSKENYPSVIELLKRDSPKGLAKAKEELSKAIT